MSISASPELNGPASHLPTKVFKGHTNTVRAVACLKDGKRLVSGSLDRTIRIWDVENGMQESMVHDSLVDSIAISPDERRLVSGGGMTTMWDLESRAVVWKTEEANGFRVAFSPDGQLIAASNRKEIVLLDAESGERIREPLHVGDYVRCLAFSPDGTQLAGGTQPGSSGGEVWIFEVATGKTVVGPFKAHASTVSSLVFTLDGQQLITASDDASIRVWDSANGREIGESMLGHKVIIFQIALSADGRRIASGSGDGAVCLWDTGKQRQIGDPFRAQHSIYSVTWSPDGLCIIAGDIEGNILLWTVPALEDDITAPVVNASSLTPPLPSTSRPRANSVSSSILNLPAVASPTLPQSPELNNRLGEDNGWELSSNESSDSVLDLPADGNQPAQRRKRRRRRAAPVSSPPISLVRTNAPPVTISAPRHSAPLANKNPSPPAQATSNAHAVADAPAPRIGTLGGLWSQRRNLPRWTSWKPGKNRDKPRESQPVEPSLEQSTPANDIETHPRHTRATSHHSEPPVDHTGKTAPKLRIIPRFLRSSKRRPARPAPESIGMQSPPSAHRRSRDPSSRTRPQRQSQSEVVNVAAGRLDQRLAASSNKWTDKIDWLDYICFCMCCPWNKVISESDSERQGQRTAAGAGGSSGSSSSSDGRSSPVDLNDIY